MFGICRPRDHRCTSPTLYRPPAPGSGPIGQTADVEFRVGPVASLPRKPAEPHAALTYDNWNDYNFHTYFHLTVRLPDGQQIEIGGVKIAKLGQQRGQHQVPREFPELGDDYASLGQESTYYEVLGQLPADVRDQILNGLRDAGADPARADRFAQEEAWTESVLRFGSATEALRSARSLLGLDDQTTSEPRRIQGFTFVANATPGSPAFTFTFTDRSHYASRVNAIIGYNGSGKTTALASLARVAHADSHERLAEANDELAGRFVGAAPSFASVIMVSYSAFDSFLLPGWRGEDDRGLAETTGEVFGYSYCGLRELPEADGGTLALKAQATLEAEFSSTLDTIVRIGRGELLDAMLARLGLEPSLAGTAAVSTLRENLSSPALGQVAAAVYGTSSSGHKIALSVLAHLVRRLQPGSLVLIDEPEAHLHPSLLSAMLTATSDLLERFDSVAVIATHSPVAIQEIPSNGVAMLRRVDDTVTVHPPEIETFGENVGLITSHVFHLDATSTDHHAVLDEMAEQGDVAAADARFPSGLSIGARAYFLSRRRRAEE